MSCIKYLTFLLLAFSSEKAKGSAVFGHPKSKCSQHQSLSTMLPTFDPNKVRIMYLRCTGGAVSATSALAPKVTPLGLSQKVGEDLAKAIGDWKSLRMTVKLTI